MGSEASPSVAKKTTRKRLQFLRGVVTPWQAEVGEPVEDTDAFVRGRTLGMPRFGNGRSPKNEKNKQTNKRNTTARVWQRTGSPPSVRFALFCALGSAFTGWFSGSITRRHGPTRGPVCQRKTATTTTTTKNSVLKLGTVSPAPLRLQSLTDALEMADTLSLTLRGGHLRIKPSGPSSVLGGRPSPPPSTRHHRG